MSVLQLQPDTNPANLSIARALSVIALVATEGEATPETDDPWRALRIHIVPRMFLERSGITLCCSTI